MVAKLEMDSFNENEKIVVKFVEGLGGLIDDVEQAITLRKNHRIVPEPFSKKSIPSLG